MFNSIRGLNKTLDLVKLSVNGIAGCVQNEGCLPSNNKEYLELLKIGYDIKVALEKINSAIFEFLTEVADEMGKKDA